MDHGARGRQEQRGWASEGSIYPKLPDMVSIPCVNGKRINPRRAKSDVVFTTKNCDQRDSKVRGLIENRSLDG